MKKILISPYSKKIETYSRNAKNYPYFKELVCKIKKSGLHTIQVGIEGEESIGCDEMQFNLSLKDLSKLIDECYGWISVDNFFHHLAWTRGKMGNVIFGPSDPNIYGHKENNNILKNRKYLAPLQFDTWENIRYNDHAFDKANIVFRKLDFITCI